MGGHAPENLVGTVLGGRYRILDVLGWGAMGTVYLGEHVKMGRLTALKVLQAADHDPSLVVRFTRGAQNAARIDHPNVCRVFDYGDPPGGLHFLAMEFIEGVSLFEILRDDGHLAPERALSIAIQTGLGLQAAHDLGIVHRDLKPANIMITRRPDGTELVKVVDFDIAKEITQQPESEVTTHGWVVGTPEYMSPEQFMGGALDGRSDVYSMGLVLFRMLSGRSPFTASDPREILLERLGGRPMTLEEATGRPFSDALQVALDGALQASREQRWSSATAFAEALRSAAEAPPARPSRNDITPDQPAAPTRPVAATGILTSPDGSSTRARETSLPATVVSETERPKPGRAVGGSGRRQRTWPRRLSGVGGLAAIGLLVAVLLPGGSNERARPHPPDDGGTVTTGGGENDASGNPRAGGPNGGMGEAPVVEPEDGEPRVAKDDGQQRPIDARQGTTDEREAPAEPPPPVRLTLEQARDTLDALEVQFVLELGRGGVPQRVSGEAAAVSRRIYDEFDEPDVKAYAAFILSKALHYQGDEAEARRWANLAVQLDPSSASFQSWRGRGSPPPDGRRSP